MRVICTTLDDFIANLRMEPPSAVLQQAVRASVSSRPLDGDKQKAVKFNVVFQASAVVNLDDGGQYLLDYGEDCGIDYRDSSQEFVGTQRANELKIKLTEFCDDQGLKIRPGVIVE